MPAYFDLNKALQITENPGETCRLRHLEQMSGVTLRICVEKPFLLKHHESNFIDKRRNRKAGGTINSQQTWFKKANPANLSIGKKYESSLVS